MKSPDRAALEHENWIAYLTGVAGCTPAVETRRIGGVVGLRSTMEFDWFNQVLVERDDAAASDLLRAAAPATRGGSGPVVRLRDGIDDRFIPDLTGNGWIAAGPGSMTPGMVAYPIDHLTTIAPDLPRFEIRMVTDAPGLEDHRLVIAEGFGVARSIAVETTGVGLLGTPECTIYVGYADALPVTSGIGWRSGRVIGVYSISTVPAARRRGYGEMMTARVIADGIVAGCDVAALQASETGRPIYERLGFRIDVRYNAYVSSGRSG